MNRPGFIESGSIPTGPPRLMTVRLPWRIVIPRWRTAALRGRSWSGRVAGLSRPPALTIALTVLTGAVSVAGLISPAVLGTLERTPAALHGEAWRWASSLLVQDGGVLGTASNLNFLAVLGAAARRSSAGRR